MDEMEKLTKETCLRLLSEKAEELKAAGQARLPARSDFSDRQVCAVKSFFGPWPRALEAAGLKEARSEEQSRKQLNLEKRIRAKRRRRERGEEGGEQK